MLESNNPDEVMAGINIFSPVEWIPMSPLTISTVFNDCIDDSMIKLASHPHRGVDEPAKENLEQQQQLHSGLHDLKGTSCDGVLEYDNSDDKNMEMCDKVQKQHIPIEPPPFRVQKIAIEECPSK